MFSAYNIRKMLPRLVIAVILIQISWPLAKFGIGLFNDLGKGIQGLMYEPFGSDADNIDVALGKIGFEGLAAGTGIFVTAAAGAVIFSGITVIGLFLLAIPVVLAALVGYLVLVFRQVIIITLVVFMPLAIVAWVLPGTEKYFKMWRDNFIKILAMYPIIMAIIAAGRIFGTLGATATAGLAGFIIILVGFFGPLFIIPKTFTWGGAALSGIGGALVNGTKGIRKRPRDLAMNRAGLNRDERKRRSQERVATGEGFNPRRFWRYPADKITSGQWDPTLGGRNSRIRQRKVTGYVAAGAASEEQDVKDADARWSQVMSQVKDHDKLAQDLAYGNSGATYETLDGKVHTLGNLSDADRRAGFNALVKYGGPNLHHVDRLQQQLNNGTAEEKILAKRMRDSNSPGLLPKMKHLYYGDQHDSSIDSMVKSLSSGSFHGMEGAEMEAILESLDRRGKTAEISRVLNFYKSDAQNENFTVGSGVNKAVKAYVDGTGLGDVNTSRTSKGLQPVARAIPASPTLATTNPTLYTQVSDLSGKIDHDGNYHR